MPPPDRCPSCGAALPANAPEGACPACLMRLGLDGPALGASRPAGVGPPGPYGSASGRESVLEELAATVGPMPCVLLRDTDAGFEPPLVRPGPQPGADSSVRYRIDGEIACGGMGTVLKGRDPDLGRDVALKVLRADLRDDPQMVRRFVEEAQIGGQLQHPGIVPIYELGTFPDRRPFFSMKLVKGHTLAALLEARKDPADERPRFLGIFEQVALTVAYAHARGVIHRDLKPSNVMVGNFGEVQVMDWGLAKVLARGGLADDATAGKTGRQDTIIATARSGSDDPELSRAGSIMGTPAYMAPEQARGETNAVDERADVFALGSILCEILTDRPAFVGRSSGEIQRKAALGDTADALARLDACGADPDLIALARACLAREPEDRPREAGQVAEVVTSYQNSVDERLRRAEVERAAEQVRAVEERRRRRVTLALAASVLATMLVGGGGAFWILQDRQRRRAGLDLALQGAELLRQQAAAATTDPMGKWQEARLAVEKASGLLGATPSAQARLRLAALQNAVGRGIARTRADEQLVALLERIRATVEGKRADAAYAAAFREAGLDPDEPAALAGRLEARPPSVRLAVVTALEAWSVVKANEAGARRLLDAARAAGPADAWRNRLRDALERKDLEGLRRLAKDKVELAKQGPVSLWLLGHRLASLGDRAAAIDVLRLAQREHPGDYWLNLELGLALMPGRRQGAETDTLGLTVGITGHRPSQAEPYLMAAVALRPTFAPAYTVLAASLAGQGRLDEAIAANRRAIAIDPGYSMAHNDLGLFLGMRGRPQEAFAETRRALALDPENEDAVVSLGNALCRLGRADDAVATLRQAIARQPNKARFHKALGGLLQERGERDEAVAAFREAIALDPDDDDSCWRLGLLLRAMGRGDEEVAFHRERIARDPGKANAHHLLGDALRARGRRDEAMAEHRRAIELDPDLAWPHHNLAQGLREQAKLEEAVSEFRKAVALNPRHGMLRESLADALRSLGRPDEAVEVHREAIRSDPTNGDAHVRLGNLLVALGRHDENLELQGRFVAVDPGSALAHQALGDALRAKGRRDEAIAEHRRAIALDPKLAWAHHELGLGLRDQGKYDEAIAEFRRALALAPSNGRMRSSLSYTLKSRNRIDEVIELEREAIRHDPANTGAHVRLGNLLIEQGRLDEDLELQRAYVALDPERGLAHLLLGDALRALGRRDEAMAEHRRAIALDPKLMWAHHNLGLSLRDEGRLDEAIAEFTTAVSLAPNNGTMRSTLDEALRARGRPAELLVSLREAIRLDPEKAEAHHRLGDLLDELGRPDEAVAAHRRAAQIAPKSPAYLFGFLNALRLQGKTGEVVAECRRLLERDPANAPARVFLGEFLRLRGELEEALAEFDRAIARFPTLTFPYLGAGRTLLEMGRIDEAADRLRKAMSLADDASSKDLTRPELDQVERMVAVQGKLPAFLEGQFQPRTVDEQLGLAGLCRIHKRHAASARLYADAFTSDPKLADDLKAGHRRQATGRAAVAGTGPPNGPEALDEPERARWRQQALDWLRADLGRCTERLESGKPADRAQVRSTLREARVDPDLEGVRDPERLAKLPDEERKAWRDFWADADAVLQRAQSH